MNRKQLVEIRPTIKKAQAKELTNDIEAFQNNTLRPIIKLQHDLWIAWFDHHLLKFKVNLRTLKLEKQQEIIQSLISKEKDLKHQCIGIVCGHFSLEEFKFYENNTSEINRRIITMVIQRLQSVLPDNN